MPLHNPSPRCFDDAIEDIAQIATTVWRRLPEWVDRDDLIQEANLRVFRHFHRFDPHLSQWSTWLYGQVTWAIKDYLRVIAPNKRTDSARYSIISLDAPVDLGPDGKDATLLEVIPDPEDPYKEVLEHSLGPGLERAILRLPPIEQVVIGLTVIGDETQKDVSEFLGVSESRVSQLRSKGLRRLRQDSEILRMAA